MCVFFRSHSKYCYKHLDTGDVQWEYPGGGEKGAAHETGSGSEDSQGGSTGRLAVDDEMDICTTPPPNVNEQLVLAAGSSKRKKCGESLFISLD